MSGAAVDAEGHHYPPTDRTTPTRNRARAHYDRAVVHGVLDEELLCHVGFVADGSPVVLPTLYVRVGERLYLHGSTGSRLMRLAEDDVEVCVTVTHLDGLVLARSAVHHSVNYRSVVVRGAARRVADVEEARHSLDRLLDQVARGRAADVRPTSAKELARTALLRLDLVEVSAKIRTGGVNDEAEDLDLPHWAGVLPVRRHIGVPQPDPALPPDTELPDYLARYADTPPVARTSRPRESPTTPNAPGRVADGPGALGERLR